jgi:hypothetical protein
MACFIGCHQVLDRFSICVERAHIFLFIKTISEASICIFSCHHQLPIIYQKKKLKCFFSLFFDSLMRSHYFISNNYFQNNIYIFNERYVSTHKYFIVKNRMTNNWDEYETDYFADRKHDNDFSSIIIAFVHVLIQMIEQSYIYVTYHALNRKNLSIFAFSTSYSFYKNKNR